MLKSILRKILFMNQQQQNILLLDKFKMIFIARFLVSLFGIIHVLSLLLMLAMVDPTSRNTPWCIILIVTYGIFILYFKAQFKDQIQGFIDSIVASLYSPRYVLKGDAISAEDFETLKKDSSDLYELMVQQETNGYCYFISFELLKCLKKGGMLFVAIKCDECEKPDNGNNDYTLHALYIHNDWCFDTFSQRQYPLEKVLKHLEAKTYISYEYKDIEGKSFSEFLAEHSKALKVWCTKNNCYQELSDV